MNSLLRTPTDRVYGRFLVMEVLRVGNVVIEAVKTQIEVTSPLDPPPTTTVRTLISFQSASVGVA
jgi:hypothetical protein